MLTKYIGNHFVIILLLQNHSLAHSENRPNSQFLAGAKTCEPAVEPLMLTFPRPGPRALPLMSQSDRSKTCQAEFGSRCHQPFVQIVVYANACLLQPARFDRYDGGVSGWAERE